jgi:hypothetical protein
MTSGCSGIPAGVPGSGHQGGESNSLQEQVPVAAIESVDDMGGAPAPSMDLFAMLAADCEASSIIS